MWYAIWWWERSLVRLLKSSIEGTSIFIATPVLEARVYCTFFSVHSFETSTHFALSLRKTGGGALALGVEVWVAGLLAAGAARGAVAGD